MSSIWLALAVQTAFNTWKEELFLQISDIKDIAKELEKLKTRIKFEFIEIDKNLTENLKKVLRNSKTFRLNQII